MTEEERTEIEEMIRKNLGEIRLFTSEELQGFLEEY